MAKETNYHYIIIKGYIHRIPINKPIDNGEDSLSLKDKQKEKKKRFKI
jgi:hypothetical protein